ncbi:hypothetical protein BDZ97DRAFT_1390102 [Flammula alnicola]|nr:hypothetical protein BDZ97DRAFT_1390102 [Flammula alnicola]
MRGMGRLKSTWDARADSQCSTSSRIPASRPSLKPCRNSSSASSWERSAKSSNAGRCRLSYAAWRAFFAEVSCASRPTSRPSLKSRSVSSSQISFSWIPNFKGASRISFSYSASRRSFADDNWAFHPCPEPWRYGWRNMRASCSRVTRTASVGSFAAGLVRVRNAKRCIRYSEGSRCGRGHETGSSATAEVVADGLELAGVIARPR